MPLYSRTITVKGDIESAFNFTADFRNLEKWDTASTAELVTNEPIREGTIFRATTDFNNREMVLDYEVIEWGAPLRASLQAETKNFKLIDTIFLSANSRGTELTYSVEVKYKGIFIIVGLFFGPIWTKLMNTQIKNLEEVLGPLRPVALARHHVLNVVEREVAARLDHARERLDVEERLRAIRAVRRRRHAPRDDLDAVLQRPRKAADLIHGGLVDTAQVVRLLLLCFMRSSRFFI